MLRSQAIVDRDDGHCRLRHQSITPGVILIDRPATPPYPVKPNKAPGRTGSVGRSIDPDGKRAGLGRSSDAHIPPRHPGGWRYRLPSLLLHTPELGDVR